MVIQIQIPRLAAPAIPPEHQPPLPINAHRMPALQAATQLFEMVARWHPQILIARRVVDHLQLAEQPAFQIRWYFPPAHIIHEERPQPNIAETDDHVTTPFYELLYHPTGQMST